MKIVILGLLGNIAIFLLFAFACLEINPACWRVEWRVFCAFIMGAITFTAFAYFIIELSNSYELDKD